MKVLIAQNTVAQNEMMVSFLLLAVLNGGGSETMCVWVIERFSKDLKNTSAWTSSTHILLTQGSHVLVLFFCDLAIS